MSHYLKKFSVNVQQHRSRFRRFLTKIENAPPKELDRIAEIIDGEVWQQVDCLACANCCKTMSPTYTFKDLKRISTYLGMTISQFKTKWLYKDKEGDWLNVNTPCQFLDTKTNMCNIYEIRPADCSGFPHLKKKKMTDYIHVHKQNVENCPATFNMVERMMKMLGK